MSTTRRRCIGGGAEDVDPGQISSVVLPAMSSTFGAGAYGRAYPCKQGPGPDAPALRYLMEGCGSVTTADRTVNELAEQQERDDERR
jgi:hypothetical protein